MLEIGMARGPARRRGRQKNHV